MGPPLSNVRSAERGLVSSGTRHLDHVVGRESQFAVRSGKGAQAAPVPEAIDHRANSWLVLEQIVCRKLPRANWALPVVEFIARFINSIRANTPKVVGVGMVDAWNEIV